MQLMLQGVQSHQATMSTARKILLRPRERLHFSWTVVDEKQVTLRRG